MNVTVAGSNGFIGKHLVRRLQEEGHHVTGLDLEPSPHADHSVTADATEEIPEEAVEGTDVVYYLLHGLSGSDVIETEKEMARNVCDACNATGVDRIIYLGGILPEEPESEHLKGRKATEKVLREADADLTAFRAGMIVGKGSASFDIMRHVVERLPVMVSTPWMGNRNQPIHVDDAMTYLVKALQEPETRDEALDIGGSTLLTYKESMETVADVLGKDLFFVPVPFLTPRLSAFGLLLITDVDYPVARSLAESLSEEMVPDDTAEKLLEVEPIGFREAVEEDLR